MLLRAADRFHGQEGRYPGAGAGDPADDVPLLRQAAQQVGAGSGAGEEAARRRRGTPCGLQEAGQAWVSQGLGLSCGPEIDEGRLRAGEL